MKSPEWLGRWLEIEREATSLLSFNPIVVNGLLQSKAYARAILQFSRQSSAVIDEQVGARIRRQSILAREDPPPPTFVANMDEAVLRRPVGGPDVMREQLMHIVEMARRSNIVVQVVPFEVGEYTGLTGPFVIGGFNGREICYVDDALAGNVIERAEEVAAIKHMWEALRGDAQGINRTHPGSGEDVDLTNVKWITPSRSTANGGECVSVVVVSFEGAENHR